MLQPARVGYKTTVLALVGVLLSACSKAQVPSAAPNSPNSPNNPISPSVTASTAVRQEVLLTGLDFPWSIAFIEKDKALVTERTGQLWLVQGQDPTWRKVARVEGIPRVAVNGQGGLFDVVLHPNYAKNGWVYLSYAASDGKGLGTELVRGRLEQDAQNPSVLRWTGNQVLFSMQPKSSGGRHFGGRIVFDRAGYVYLTLGDRGDEARAQRTGDHAGSVVRLHDDGRVPTDNPWAGNKAYLPEKFTLGQRNMQGAALHPETGVIWTHEHGPQGGDEINPVRAGKNYGWPAISYGVNYVIGTQVGEGTHKAGMEQPWTVWIPSIAPSGMAFYTGAAFPQWKGDMLVGALRGQTMVRLRKTGEKWIEQERLLTDQIGRIRDVRTGPDGLVYLLTDSPEGQLIRLRPLGAENMTPPQNPIN